MHSALLTLDFMHLQRLTSQSDNEVERYRKLKADLKPSVETQMNQIEEKYQKLCC